MKARSSRARIVLLAAIAAAAGCSPGAEPEASADRLDATTGDEHGDAAATPLDAGPLPATTKGYELYAWDGGGALSFTLITGTNRLKTVSEIVGAQGEVQDGEWVVIRGHGLAALAAVLERVPAGTSVVLSALEGLPPLSAAGRGEVAREIAESAR